MQNKPSENTKHDDLFVSDKRIAEMLSVTPSWVRKQRSLRLNKQEHVLTIDPIYVGSSPRYETEEVLKWIHSLKQKSM